MTAEEIITDLLAALGDCEYQLQSTQAVRYGTVEQALDHAHTSRTAALKFLGKKSAVRDLNWAKPYVEPDPYDPSKDV